MIKVEVPIDKIPQIRTIEGRQFKDGFWYFPDSSIEKLQVLGLVDGDFQLEEKKELEYEISTHLRDYQKSIVNKALNHGSYGIFTDTGTGKTVIGLEIAHHYTKTLIVCPLSIISTAWIEDCNKFYPDKKIINLWDKSKKVRLQKLNEVADIYVVNYEGLNIIYNEIVKAKLDCIIVDESSKMKNNTAKITQTLLQLKDCIGHRYVLSGCPTPNHNSEIFSQMKFINEEVFGINYYGFLGKYFSQDMENPHRWYQTDENKEKYFSRLREQSVFLSKDDCVDLPDKTFLVRKFDLAKEQRVYYDNMIQDIKDNINNWSKFEFTAKLMKLREITSGFVIAKNGGIDEFKTNKDIELKQVLDELGDKQVIIWCQFNHEIEKLSKMFDGVGLTSKTKDRDKIISDFKQGNIKRLFVHPKLLGMGVTFTGCNYNIYYSLSYSYEEFKQSQDRIHRIGQQNKCTYVILQSTNTIDENIYRCLSNKNSAVDELYLELSYKH